MLFEFQLPSTSVYLIGSFIVRLVSVNLEHKLMELIILYFTPEGVTFMISPT